ncbi:MAG: hypothetical protein KGK16_03555 [Bradyrhizobium sp.]|nr:hypothetical protein [Bradyrhizobium sp.]
MNSDTRRLDDNSYDSLIRAIVPTPDDFIAPPTHPTAQEGRRALKTIGSFHSRTPPVSEGTKKP